MSTAALPDDVSTGLGVRVRIVLAAGAVGLVTVGVLSRLAMRLLLVLNADADGAISDDGFEMGRVTLGGSLNLAAVGVVLGLLSGLIYLVLDPLRLGPRWFRRLSLAVGAGVVAAAGLVHTDGVDFHLLGPALLAITLFTVIPLLHVLLVDLAADRIRGPGARSRGWTRWLGDGPFREVVLWVLRAALAVWFAAALSELLDEVRYLT